MRLLWCLAFLLAPLAGCAAEAPSDASEPVPVVTLADPWGGGDRVLVANFYFDGMELDLPACSNGGASTTAPEFPRSELVHPGADRLEVWVSAEATMLGVQVGYRHGDADDYTWLPVVFASSETFTIPVAPEQWEVVEATGDDELEFAEDEAFAWEFNHRINLPDPATQDCWTGGGAGRFDVTVEAVKGA